MLNLKSADQLKKIGFVIVSYFITLMQITHFANSSAVLTFFKKKYIFLICQTNYFMIIIIFRFGSQIMFIRIWFARNAKGLSYSALLHIFTCMQIWLVQRKVKEF